MSTEVKLTGQHQTVHRTWIGQLTGDPLSVIDTSEPVTRVGLDRLTRFTPETIRVEYTDEPGGIPWTVYLNGTGKGARKRAWSWYVGDPIPSSLPAPVHEFIHACQQDSRTIRSGEKGMT